MGISKWFTYRNILRWIFTYKIKINVFLPENFLLTSLGWNELRNELRATTARQDFVSFSCFSSCPVARNSLHPRLVSRKFAAVYLPLLPLPRDEFYENIRALLLSNRKGANDVTVGGWHTEFSIRCDRASIVGFLDNTWGPSAWSFGRISNVIVLEETSGFRLACCGVWKLCDAIFLGEKSARRWIGRNRAFPSLSLNYKLM